MATATMKHLSFLEDDALRFVANREYGWELVMWLALVTESYVFAACAREVAWLRLVVDEAALTSSDIGAATSEVKKGIATDLKWARGEIKKNNVWWS